MPKPPQVKLTKLEMEIMDAVWALGQASVREVQEHLPERKRPAYTTVQTIIYRLEEKGAVRRVKKIGNAHIFEAVVTRKAAHSRLIDELLHVFGGSPRLLVAQLVETGQVTLDDLKELEATIETLTMPPEPAKPPTLSTARSKQRPGRTR
ncbi:MAG TPA: BlaI/MecI/CopY family transcriptional regulator [Pyrinomonadaceae bacterium]|nr:BlaI/MecI/CopY family transcriptional regulator [Pyrinomonadaceae bacterium]